MPILWFKSIWHMQVQFVKLVYHVRNRFTTPIVIAMIQIQIKGENLTRICSLRLNINQIKLKNIWSKSDIIKVTKFLKFILQKSFLYKFQHFIISMLLEFFKQHMCFLSLLFKFKIVMVNHGGWLWFRADSTGICK